MLLVIASNNKGKCQEIQAILQDFFPHIQSMEQAGLRVSVKETGATFEENARLKAAAIASPDWAVLADDSGLAVDALGGRPGIHSARYAGEPCDDGRNMDKLLCELADVPLQGRSARFICCMVLLMPNGTYHTAFGELEGRIASRKAGQNGFGYDPLFIPAHHKITLAQMDSERKNKLSHRYRALCGIQDALQSEKEKWF